MRRTLRETPAVFSEELVQVRVGTCRLQASTVIRIPMKNLSRILLLCVAFVAPAFAQSKTEPPVPVRTVAPEYPGELRRDGISGLVMVKCTIDEQGNVIDPQVEKSSNAAFEKPAVEALKKWKFKPAKQDGAAVAIKVSIPIKFVFES
jgi:periplasmic protein TonB